MSLQKHVGWQGSKLQPKSSAETETLRQLRNLKTSFTTGITSSLTPDELLRLRREQEDKENRPPSANRSTPIINESSDFPSQKKNMIAQTLAAEIDIPNWAKPSSSPNDPNTRSGKIFQEAKLAADGQLKQTRESMPSKIRRKHSGELDSDGERIPSSTTTGIKTATKQPKTSPTPYIAQSSKTDSKNPSQDQAKPLTNGDGGNFKLQDFFSNRKREKTPERFDLLASIESAVKGNYSSLKKPVQPVVVSQRSQSKHTLQESRLQPSTTPSPVKLPFNVNSFARSIAASGSKPQTKLSNTSSDAMNQAFLDTSKQSQQSHTSEVSNILGTSGASKYKEPPIIGAKDPFVEWNKAAKQIFQDKELGVKIEEESDEKGDSDEKYVSQDRFRAFGEEAPTRIASMSVAKMKFANTFQVTRQIMNDTPIKARVTVKELHPKETECQEGREISFSSEALPTFGELVDSNQVPQTPGFGKAESIAQTMRHTPVFGEESNSSSNQQVFFSFGKGVVIQPTPSFAFPAQDQPREVTPTFGQATPFTYHTLNRESSSRHTQKSFSFGQKDSGKEISPVRSEPHNRVAEWVKDKCEDEDSLLMMLRNSCNSP